jgi:hypothetical protein
LRKFVPRWSHLPLYNSWCKRAHFSRVGITFLSQHEEDRAHHIISTKDSATALPLP